MSLILICLLTIHVKLEEYLHEKNENHSLFNYRKIYILTVKSKKRVPPVIINEAN